MATREESEEKERRKKVEMKGRGSRGLLFRNGDGKGRKMGNERGERTKGEKPALPMKNRSLAPGKSRVDYPPQSA